MAFKQGTLAVMEAIEEVGNYPIRAQAVKCRMTVILKEAQRLKNLVVPGVEMFRLGAPGHNMTSCVSGGRTTKRGRRAMKITGTFLDEITHDIPSNNWGCRVGAGLPADEGDRHRHGDPDPRQAPRAHRRIRRRCCSARSASTPSTKTWRTLFLDLAEENGMDFYFGTYDSVSYAAERSIQEHLTWAAPSTRRGRAYGRRAAFRGWYLTFEISRKEPTRLACLRQLGEHCKALSRSCPR